MYDMKLIKKKLDLNEIQSDVSLDLICFRAERSDDDK